MKTTLNSLLKQITPLPWKVTIWAGEKPGVSNERGHLAKMFVFDKYMNGDAKASAAYLAHASNQLPHLVAALHDCAMSMERLDDKEDAYRVTCLQQARQALADAQEVEL